VLILTHGRPKEQKTLELLRKSGYTGRIWLVVDDLDETLDEYRRIYGDSVIVFDKQAYREITDTCDNTKNLATVVYARNASYDIADELGLDYFVQCDDDIMSLAYRYRDKGKLKGLNVRDMDGVFEAYVEFMKAGDFPVLGFGAEIDTVGGRLKEVVFDLYQIFICRTDRRVDFIGTVNEDTNTMCLLNSVGALTPKVCTVQYSSDERGTNKGGLSRLYTEFNEYLRMFYTVMVFPSGVKISKGRTIEFSLKKSKNNIVPRIVREDVKK